MLMSFGILHRLRVPEFAQSRSLVAPPCKHPRKRIVLVLVLFMLLCCWAAQSHGAKDLECPEVRPAGVPDLTGDATGGGLFATENRVDLANEINDLINRLQLANHNISWSEVQNVLIAAYCRVVAREHGLTAAEKWGRMRQFDGVMERQIAANMMPTGALIIANVPLAPDVFRELRRQAVASN